MMNEEVMVIPASLSESLCGNDDTGLVTADRDSIYQAILGRKRFLPRDSAEHDYQYRQVIPYVVIRNDKNYLLMQRLNKQTEQRLHNKYSLGIGGHINPEPDLGTDNIIIRGLYRELNEEVSVDTRGELSFAGIIHDSSNSVSRVHMGLLYILDAASSEYQVLETDKMTAQWADRDMLTERYDRFETWSQIVFNQYIYNRKEAGEINA